MRSSWFAVLLILASAQVFGGTFTVSKTADTNDGVCNADCSLREAVAAANAAAGDDNIAFDASVFGTPRTIDLTSRIVILNNGAVAIDGPGRSFLTVRGNNANSLFFVSDEPTNIGARFSIKSMTLANGYSEFGGGAVFGTGTVVLDDLTITGNSPSAILNWHGAMSVRNSTIQGNNGLGLINETGTVTIDHSEFTGNTSTAVHNGRGMMTVTYSSLSNNLGRGIQNNGGKMTIFRSEIRGNRLSGYNDEGGGVFNYSDDSVSYPALIEIVESTIAANTVTGTVSDGGGLASWSGSATIVRSAITDNASNENGGGVANLRQMVIRDSTISGNRANGDGGGIYNDGWEMNLFNVTVASNRADHNQDGVGGRGGGIRNNGDLTVFLNLRSVIVGDNEGNGPVGADYSGLLYSLGRNVIENPQGVIFQGSAENILWTDPRLDPLADNGGPTRTHALREFSVAIDYGDPGYVTPKDQRGYVRPQDGNGDGIVRPDAGAFEVGSAILSRGPVDYDGDRRSDISVFRPSNGQWWLNRSTDGVIAHTFGNSTDTVVPADFTGDGKADVAIWRAGVWFILRSENGSFYSFPFGTSGDVPVPGDYDGDGKADAAVFRPSVSTWYIERSSGVPAIERFGAAGDRPVPADYDGDGKTDIAMFRPSNGQWWLNRSIAGVIAVTFGNSADLTVPGDFTGDGKADVALFRPSSGEWFVLRSEDFSFYSFPFGSDGDRPVPGDYDGDGRFDPAVFRPANATWYIDRSSSGILIQTFGAQTDLPLPSTP